jgi:hypothetical protein
MNNRKAVLIITFLLLMAINTYSQPGGGGDPGGGQPVPLSGVEFLLGLGAALGVKRLMDLRKRTK